MKLLKLGALIAILFLSACSVPQYVVVPVEYTPKLYLNPDSARVLLVNQFDINQIKNSTKRKLDVIKGGAFTSLKYAQKQFSQLSKVTVINTVDSASFKVNTDSIKVLASKYHANFVLALTNFSANIDMTDMQAYTVSYNSNVQVDFTLFENNGIYFKKLTGSANDLQSQGPNMGLLGNLIIHPTVGGNKTAINTAAEHAAKAAIQDYLPITISHNRPLYDDEWLQPSITQIKAGNYEKADTLLQTFLKDKNLLIASKAAYTLAVVYEYEGDIESAIDIAQVSLDKFKNTYAEAILNELKGE